MHGRVVALLAAAPLMLAACGGGGGAAQTTTSVAVSPAAAVRQAAQKTGKAASEHVSLSADVTAQGQKVTMTGDGSFDNAKHLGQMTLHASVSGLDLDVQEVLDRTVLYLKTPLLQAALPQGKTWARIDLQTIGTAQGFDLSSLLSQDPSQAFSQLQASSDVTKVGTETIDGVDTTHYRGTIDLSKLPQASKLKQFASGKETYDAWVDGDGYIRRIVTSSTIQKQTLSVTMNFSDFGKSVSVTIPSPSETADMTSKSLQGLGG